MDKPNSHVITGHLTSHGNDKEKDALGYLGKRKNSLPLLCNGPPHTLINNLAFVFSQSNNEFLLQSSMKNLEWSFFVATNLSGYGGS